ncbi:hypothetical protein [Bradyrhizobium liaoningense]|uniref:hypothetical protein n=1 Tax=Bradyrhizobium liaoningense TaxID=43992 RepID=UPI0012FD0211|nr:hypothetical protein [Bradyrhizobium liaoningense]
MRPSLDDLRTERPDLSFALYAMTPGADVTLEIYHGGQVYTFNGATEADAILAAFPPAPEAARVELELAPPATPDSIFD